MGPHLSNATMTTPGWLDFFGANLFSRKSVCLPLLGLCFFAPHVGSHGSMSSQSSQRRRDTISHIQTSPSTRETTAQRRLFSRQFILPKNKLAPDFVFVRALNRNKSRAECSNVVMVALVVKVASVDETRFAHDLLLLSDKRQHLSPAFFAQFFSKKS